MPRLTVAVFALSAALAGLAGAVEMLGVEGNVRADWNPAFSLTVVPLVFLARFNGFASIVFVFLFSVLSIGGESAARLLGVPNFFTLVVVAVAADRSWPWPNMSISAIVTGRGREPCRACSRKPS